MQLHAVKSIGINAVRVQRRKRCWLDTKSNCPPKIAVQKTNTTKTGMYFKTALIKTKSHLVCRKLLRETKPLQAQV